MSHADPTIEERIAKLERMLAKIMAIAERHPMGRMILKLLDE